MSGVEAQLADTSKNVIICHSCANDLVGEYVSCQGFCNAVFHPQCCGIPSESMKDVISHRQIFWLCKSCSNLMLDLRHRRSVQCAFEAGQELSLSHHNRIVEQLKTEIVTELRAELSSNFAKFISSNSLTPRSAGRGVGGSVIPGNRRLFDINPRPVPGKATDAPPEVTSDTCPPPGEFAAANEGPRFWLYLSRVSRRVTEDQIVKLAIDRLRTTDILATRLVAKGRDVSKMKFISFKVGMHVSLKAKALSQSTWPEGLVVREFEDRSSENFWEPADGVNPSQSLQSAPTTLPLTTLPLPNPTSPFKTPQPNPPLQTTTPQPNPTLPPNSTPMSTEPVSPMSTSSLQANTHSD
ncbi:uncharacterized protein LOC120414626 [Culex pipiens pallens]|uniref:uncharacterized protein LOC120414626 n=1 Tax=Culex pipiens pallens TaxID=42434 RepID=UPI0022AAF539|nr:uncharacterized protein LOC120414626 [Culex pipiens pallens]